MYARDRLANLTIIVAAVATWAGVALVFTTRSPVGDPAIQLTGALLLGGAVGLTVLPVFWLLSFASRRRIAHRGDWLRAGRRALLTALIVALLVVLRELSAFSIAIAAFVVVMAVLVELTLTLRR